MAAGSLAYGLAAGLCALAAVVFLAMNARRRGWEPRTMSFAIASLMGFVGAIATVWLHTRPDIESYSNAVKWAFGFSALVQGLAVLWLVAAWTEFGSRRSIVGFGVAAALLSVVQIVTPTGLIVGEITSLRTVGLFGEDFVVHRGSASPWRPLLDAYLVAVTIFIVAALVRGWRRHRADTRLLVVALAIMSAFNVWDAMVDAGRVDTPYLLPFSFIFLTLAGALHIARRAADTTVRLHTEATELRTLATDRSIALDEATGRLEQSVEHRRALERQLSAITSDIEFLNSMSVAVSDRADLHAPLVALLGHVADLLAGDAVRLELDEVETPNGVATVTTWIRAENASRSMSEIHRDDVQVGDQRLGTLVVSGSRLHPLDPNRLSIVGLVVDQVAAFVLRLQLSDIVTASAIDEERHRLARELHDSVTQRLYSAAFLAEALPRLTERDGPIAGETALRIRAIVLSSLAELRSLLFELRPLELDAAPIAELLNRLGENLRDTTSVTIVVDADEGPALLADIKIGLYRIAQEATANAARHANATRIEIVLERSGAGAHLEIRDDGRGFVVDADDDGHGLQSIRERAALIGAELRIESSETAGSIVAATWPSQPDREFGSMRSGSSTLEREDVPS
jgi:signal transduction histidine kinase